MNSEVKATCLEVLRGELKRLDEYGYTWGHDIRQQVAARIEATIEAIEREPVDAQPGVSMEEAQKLIAEKFSLRALSPLRLTAFSHVYPNSAGPLGGIGGQALTTFWPNAWFDPEDGYAVVFYGNKVLEVMGFLEFEVYSTYGQRRAPSPQPTKEDVRDEG